MVDTQMPIEWWPQALGSFRDSRNLWPKSCSVVLRDGDALLLVHFGTDTSYAYTSFACTRYMSFPILSRYLKAICKFTNSGRHLKVTKIEFTGD